MEVTIYHIIDKSIITTAFMIFVYFLSKEIYRNKSKNKWWLKRWKEKDYIQLKWLLDHKWAYVIFAIFLVIIMILSRLFLF
ncbi:unnamed protein product [marine sediment metagenome]|uniref:Uncharacterized protein n=1 Tax=marine sediment metagenome TaxID=412755 RepID=X0T9Y5_9ZZZZ